MGWVMAYNFHSEKSLNYYPCQYGNSRLQLRGPKQVISGRYVAVLGGTETYGKFVPAPFSCLVEDEITLPVVNLGCVNAGPDVYLNDPEVMEIASGAVATVVQIVGAQNISNRYYSVHPRRNDRFLGASPLLRTLYPKVDFTEFNFTRHMLAALQRASADRFEVVAEELRAAWVLRMNSLIAGLSDRSILLWMSGTAPPQPEHRVDLAQLPLLIDAEMIAAVRSGAARYLEVVYSAEGMAQGCKGMAYGPLEAIAAEELPSPALHAEVAARLLPLVKSLIRSR
jgi:hypothetical protein